MIDVKNLFDEVLQIDEKLKRIHAENLMVAELSADLSPDRILMRYIGHIVNEVNFVATELKKHLKGN